MRAAIIGGGVIANAHAEALRSNGIELAAIITSNNETARIFAERWHVPHYGDDISVLYRLGIDSVHVCTPPRVHSSQVNELLNHNMHILCEKPLSVDVEDARLLAERACTSEYITALGLNVRYAPPITRMRNIVRSRDFGDILLIHGSYLQQFGLIPTPYSWRFNKTLAGKMRAVTEIGTHWFDLIQYLTGLHIMRVSAIFHTPSPQRYEVDAMLHKEETSSDSKAIWVQSEDTALIHLQFDNNSVGSLTLSQISQGRINRLCIEISGEQQSSWWNSEDATQLNWADRNGIHRELFPFGNNGFNDSIRQLVHDYYKSISEGKNSNTERLPNFKDGLQLALICEGVYKSAENNGAWIDIERASNL